MSDEVLKSIHHTGITAIATHTMYLVCETVLSKESNSLHSLSLSCCFNYNTCSIKWNFDHMEVLMHNKIQKN